MAKESIGERLCSTALVSEVNDTNRHMKGD